MYQSVDKNLASCFLFVLLVLSSNLTQASVVKYSVTGIFADAIYPTQFDGSFDWNGTEVSSFHGKMNSSMWEVDNETPDYSTRFPIMHLDYQLAQSVDGNIVTASVFKENTTDVFRGEGYQTKDVDFYGYYDGNTRNWNAYFTFAFDKTTMEGVLSEMVYGDCTDGGMMGATCMTGHQFGGTMGAVPSTIEITPQVVPVPAAVWFFGTALAGLVGVSRRRV